MPLNYNYDYAKTLTKELGFIWLGDSDPYLEAADRDALIMQMTQKQVDTAMHWHLHQSARLWDYKTYTFLGRVVLALYFLTGIKPKAPK
jgi:hypothetical protein